MNSTGMNDAVENTMVTGKGTWKSCISKEEIQLRGIYGP